MKTSTFRVLIWIELNLGDFMVKIDAESNTMFDASVEALTKSNLFLLKIKSFNLGKSCEGYHVMLKVGHYLKTYFTPFLFSSLPN